MNKWKCTKKNKDLTINQYVDIYSGPEYVSYIKVSFILKHIYITMFFGLALPIVFPIATLAILNQYVFDKLSLAYFYRIPPKFDDKLIQTAVRMLMYAPILGLAFSYWILGNPAIFLNNKKVLTLEYETLNPNHPIISLHK